MIALVRFWKEGAAIVLVIMATVLWQQKTAALVREGRALERVRVADSILAIEKPIVVRLDTVVQHDTRTVTRTIARVDSLRDTLLVHLTDTLVVKEYVARTDSALKACTELSNDCAAFRASALTAIKALETKLAAQPMVIAKSCTMSNVVAAMAGVGATWLAVKR